MRILLKTCSRCTRNMPPTTSDMDKITPQNSTLKEKSFSRLVDTIYNRESRDDILHTVCSVLVECDLLCRVVIRIRATLKVSLVRMKGLEAMKHRPNYCLFKNSRGKDRLQPRSVPADRFHHLNLSIIEERSFRHNHNWLRKHLGPTSTHFAFSIAVSLLGSEDAAVLVALVDAA